MINQYLLSTMIEDWWTILMTCSIYKITSTNLTYEKCPTTSKLVITTRYILLD